MATTDLSDWVSDATKIVTNAGFNPTSKPGWLKRGTLYAFLDAPSLPVGQRCLGIYEMHLTDELQEMMHATVLIPWYGDGLDRIGAASLAMAAISHLIYGSSE